MFDWSDLRYFVAVARSGSLSGAARELKVNYSTVFRRIGALEASIGARLFDRLPGGYGLTAAGEQRLERATRVEEEINTLDRQIAGEDLRLCGSIRVTVPEGAAARFFQQHLFSFHQAYPGIQVEVIMSNEIFNLSKREADIALRGARDPQGDMVGRRLSSIAWAVYGSASYLKDHPAPREPADLAEHKLVAADEDSLGFFATRSWMETHAPAEAFVYRSNSMLGQCNAIQLGFGLGILPCFLGDPEPDLVRVMAPIESLAGDLWLLTHPDLRRVARIRAFMDFVSEAVVKDRPLLEGNGPRVEPSIAKTSRRPRAETGKPAARRAAKATARA